MLKVPLHFTAEQDGSSVSFVCYNPTVNNWKGELTDSWCEVEYSMTGKDDDWQPYIDPNSEDEILHNGKVINLNKGETVYFKAKQGNVKENPNLNGFAQYDEKIEDIIKYHYFILKGSIKAAGNIQFLLENTGTKMEVPDYCYYGMFYNYPEEYNTALTQAPLLPATTLANRCYDGMFQNCTSLTQAPELPAETLITFCYRNMFSNCTSLTQAPELPAETLNGCCYQNMFEGCTSLAMAPALPATTLE
jgi:hypothetical protein